MIMSSTAMVMPPRVEYWKPIFLISLTTSAVSYGSLKQAIAVGHDACAAACGPWSRCSTCPVDVGSARLKMRPADGRLDPLDHAAVAIGAHADLRLKIDRVRVVRELDLFQ